jgi:hypothetical protein
VTPPGGSRDDDADRARHDDEGAGEPGSDPQLRAMRAVWLAMRDEDPPDRGLADLLAAAHHKAGAMQPRPSAWQRLLAALRRAPVLAIATVTVLIAGAVLIGRRVSLEGGAATAPSPSIQRDAASPGSAEGAGSVAAGTYRTGQATAVVPPAATQPIAPPPERDSVCPAAPARPATPPAPPRSRKMAAPGEAPRHGDDRDTGEPVPEAAAPPADPAAAPAPPETVPPLGASAVVSSADIAGAGNAPTADHWSRAELDARPPVGASNGPSNTAGNSANSANSANDASNPVASGVAAPARRPSPTAPRAAASDDLPRQCEAAARRGDCAAVRRLIDQISRTDRGYRARVTKDSPVGRCLAD